MIWGAVMAAFTAVAMAQEAPTQPPTAAVTNNATVGPQIRFETPIYDFGKVKGGDPVKYTYSFTNSGDQALEIQRVQPSCGCTTAGEFTKLVKPGETGIVPVQFNSGNFNGQVFKTITVTSNDRTTPTVVLQLKGTVWKPIELVPPYTILNIPPDAPNASAVVRIINNMEEPITLSNPESSNKGFTAELKSTQLGKEYQLTIAAVPPLNPGSLQGKVTMKTSTTNVPSIEVNFWANVQPPIAVMPPQLMLPIGPLTTKATPSVTIQNNSTNTVTLSDPAVNVPGVEVQIKELQPGRIFNASFTFPEGFAVQPGQQVVFTAKSSNPQYPLIKVPVMQMMRPGPAGSPHASPTAVLPQAAAPTQPVPVRQVAR